MARQQVPNLEQENQAPANRDAQLRQKGNGPRWSGDRFKAKTRSSKSRSPLMTNVPTVIPIRFALGLAGFTSKSYSSYSDVNSAGLSGGR